MEFYKRIDASYYGYRDDEDGILEKLEGPAEKRMRATALEDWMEMKKIKKEARRAVKSGDVKDMGNVSNILFEEADVLEEKRMKDKEREENEKENEFVAHVPPPDQKEIGKMVLENRKKDIFDKYTRNALQKKITEEKILLNIQR
ncbi:uncharacterized protein LOC142541097 [Primulina tabacum]|uniref:uncharacterized protein LOC142541097 n=1 Tax=Primulina tabacum TaxID=48773 RepID=UPI003F595DF0